MDAKISAGLWTFGMGADRFVIDGYRTYVALEDRIRGLSCVEGIIGIELTYPGDVNEQTWSHIKRLLSDTGLEISSLCVDLTCDQQWRTGSLSSRDKNRRAFSISLIKSALSFASSIEVKTLVLWFGQDGFDYMFQNDYAKAYTDMVGGLTECAKYKPDVNIAIEYKAAEPKMSCLVKNAGMAMSIAQATSCANVGVTLNVGQSFNAGENPAEIATILLAQNRLFHIHMNDNYGISDDQLLIGSVHWIHYIELCYWLKRMKYKGWLSLDLFPYRDEPNAACEASVTFIKSIMDFVNNRLPADFVGSHKGATGYILNDLFKLFFNKGD